MKKYILSVIVVLLCACTIKNKPSENEVLVFGAASLKNVLTELAQSFETTKAIKVNLNFASSGTLARQIEHGAKPGIYIAANEKWVNYLIEADFLSPDSKKKWQAMCWLLWIPIESQLDSISFSDSFPQWINGRLAMGDPKHVPAGDYAWQAIEKAGFASVLKGRILPAKDVRTALMFVELSEAEAGIVYKTDALKSEKVKIVALIPNRLHSEIGLFAAMLKDIENEHSKVFYNYLSSDKTKKIWLKHGFTIE